MNVTIVPARRPSGPPRRPTGRRRQLRVAGRRDRAGRRSRTSSPRCARRPTPTRAAGSGRRGGSTASIAAPARGTCRRGPARRPATCTATGPGRLPRGDGVGGAEQQHVGAVGQHDQRDDLAGLGRLERGASSSSAGWAAPVLPTVARGRRRPRPAAPSRPASAVAARACGPVTITRSTCVGFDSSAAFSASRQARSPSGTYSRLAEALLPHLRADVAGRAPAVEELLGDRRAAEVLGDRRRRRRRRRARRRRRRRAASSPLPGRPVRTSAATTSVVPRPASATPQGADGRALRAAEVEGGHVVVEAQGGVDGGGVGLVDVRGRHRARTTARRAAALGRRPQRRAGRPRRPSSSCPRRRTRRCACPCPRPRRRPARSSVRSSRPWGM